MARVDRILALVTEQGANELRMGSDREPRMLAHGVSKHLAIPTTDVDTLRELLGELLPPEREQQLETQGHLELRHAVAGLGSFKVVLTARPQGFDVVFFREQQAAAMVAPAVVAAGPVRAAPVSTAPGRKAGAVEPTHTEPGEMAAVASTADLVVQAELLRLFALAAQLRASDLHLAVGDAPVVRVDGRLRPLRDEPRVEDAWLRFDAAIEAEIHRRHSADFAVVNPGGGRLRMHVFVTDTGRACSVRLLPGQAPTLASLRLPVPLEGLLDSPHGLVLVCGATGSGKSTTLAALGRELVTRRSVVLATLEDPIEYMLPASDSSVVRRRQVGRDVADFASGLRDALRQDPDVLLIGELRDAETIGLALTAAETGHLVLASIHAGSAAGAIERIVDAYPPARATQIRVQLADVVRAVVAQRLLPAARGGGRLPALEVMLGSSAVAALVREGKTAQLASTIQASRREGMLSLERSLADRVLAGEVRVEDARAAANSRAVLDDMLAHRPTSLR